MNQTLLTHSIKFNLTNYIYIQIVFLLKSIQNIYLILIKNPILYMLHLKELVNI